VNPKTPAMIATTKKMSVQRNIIFRFKWLMSYFFTDYSKNNTENLHWAETAIKQGFKNKPGNWNDWRLGI
jgi:hypothetical protein